MSKIEPLSEAKCNPPAGFDNFVTGAVFGHCCARINYYQTLAPGWTPVAATAPLHNGHVPSAHMVASKAASQTELHGPSTFTFYSVWPAVGCGTPEPSRSGSTVGWGDFENSRYFTCFTLNHFSSYSAESKTTPFYGVRMMVTTPVATTMMPTRVSSSIYR